MTEQTIRTQMLLGEAALARLRSSRVAVLGLGGVGSWCAEALAAPASARSRSWTRTPSARVTSTRQLRARTPRRPGRRPPSWPARVHDIDPSIAVDARAERYEAATPGAGFSTRSMIILPTASISCRARWI